MAKEYTYITVQCSLYENIVRLSDWAIQWIHKLANISRECIKVKPPETDAYTRFMLECVSDCHAQIERPVNKPSTLSSDHKMNYCLRWRQLRPLADWTRCPWRHQAMTSVIPGTEIILAAVMRSRIDLWTENSHKSIQHDDKPRLLFRPSK